MPDWIFMLVARQRSAFIDARVCHPNAESYNDLTIQYIVKATFGELASHFNTPWFGYFSLLFPMIVVTRLS